MATTDPGPPARSSQIDLESIDLKEQRKNMSITQKLQRQYMNRVKKMKIKMDRRFVTGDKLDFIKTASPSFKQNPSAATAVPECLLNLQRLNIHGVRGKSKDSKVSGNAASPDFEGFMQAAESKKRRPRQTPAASKVVIEVQNQEMDPAYDLAGQQLVQELIQTPGMHQEGMDAVNETEPQLLSQMLMEKRLKHTPKKGGGLSSKEHLEAAYIQDQKYVDGVVMSLDKEQRNGMGIQESGVSMAGTAISNTNDKNNRFRGTLNNLGIPQQNSAEVFASPGQMYSPMGSG